jgi:serine/threonine protein kinase
MSPEAILGGKYDAKTDIWSVGITLIEIAQGFLPFKDMNIMQAIGVIAQGAPPTVAEPSKFSAEFNSFIAECLVKENVKRKNAQELFLVL